MLGETVIIRVRETCRSDMRFVPGLRRNTWDTRALNANPDLLLDTVLGPAHMAAPERG